MSQDQVLKLLSRKKKPLTVTQMEKILKIRSVGRSVFKLRKYNEIKMAYIKITFECTPGTFVTREVAHYFV